MEKTEWKSKYQVWLLIISKMLLSVAGGIFALFLKSHISNFTGFFMLFLALASLLSGIALLYYICKILM